MSVSARASLDVRGEILKLARLLRLDPSELEYLEQVPAEDLRALREQVTEVLFSASSQALGRLAAASKLLPIKVVAVIGERAFGAVLAARIAGMLDPERAVEMANTMPIEFLADVAIELDPRRASAVISLIPPQRIAEITKVLLRRGEYVTMGRFVGHLGDAALRAALGVMSDAELLRVGFVLESKDGLGELIGMLPQQRLDKVVDVAAQEGLWVEVLDLLSHLSEERRAELAGHAGELDDRALHQLVHDASQSGLLVELLPLVAVLPDASQRRLAGEVARLEPAQREQIERFARDAGMVAQLALLEQARIGRRSGSERRAGDPST
jgi:hypothetical protein